MELMTGSILRNRYEIKEQLGKGGMGAVYLAEDRALDQLVAVKANAITSEQGRRQFETEARLLAKLRHPNLPLVFDHFILENVQYLVMDYIPGDDLNNRLKEEGPQSVVDVLEWAKQVGDALDYLHSQQPPVIHRDIKPANLKLTPEGQVVLVDFGIAKATEGDTTVGARGYSPGYAPPEQYSNATTGPFSDQYSLAATVYALLTGGPPPESVDVMLGHETLTPTRHFSQNIPHHVDNAIQKAMSIEPINRFDSVPNFVKALTDPSALADETQPLPQEQAQPQPKKGTGWLAIIGLLVVIVVGAGGFLAGRIFRGNNGPFDGVADLSPTDPVAVAVVDTETPSPTNTLFPTPTLEPTATFTATPEPSATLTATPKPTPLGRGGKIAFVSQRDGNTHQQIYVMDSDGSNVTQLTYDEVNKSWPMWSPDGKQILYVADGGYGPYNSRYNLDIWVMNADGSNPINLTEAQGVDEDPIWSPNGNKIVWVSRRFGGTRQLMIMNADGSEPERLSNEFEEYNPTFSPDGEILLFSSTFFFTLNIRIPDMEEEESGPYDYTEIYDDRYDEPDRIGKAIEPAWSPDGNFIVFVRTTGNNRHIYVVDANSNGATVTDLTKVGLNFDPAWSPDSRWILFATTRDGNSEIYTMDFAGRFLTNLTNNPAEDKMPSWQPIIGD
jgi:Tol biopolymer transport system component/serine/threonine protein kinase